VILGPAHMSAAIERQKQASNRVLAFHIRTVQRHEAPARPQYLGRGCKQRIGQRIGEVMQDAERDDHVERTETVHGLQRDGANDKQSAMTIALPGCSDIGRLDVVAIIIDVARKLREDVSSATADVEYPLSGIDLEKVVYQATGGILG